MIKTLGTLGLRPTHLVTHTSIKCHPNATPGCHAWVSHMKVFSVTRACHALTYHVTKQTRVGVTHVNHQELSQKSRVCPVREVTTARHLDLKPSVTHRVTPATTAAKVRSAVFNISCLFIIVTKVTEVTQSKLLSVINQF